MSIQPRWVQYSHMGSLAHHNLLRRHQQGQARPALAASLDRGRASRLAQAKAVGADAFMTTMLAGSTHINTVLHPVFGHAQSPTQIQALRDAFPGSPIAPSVEAGAYGWLGRMGEAIAAAAGPRLGGFPTLQSVAAGSCALVCQLSALLGAAIYLGGMGAMLPLAGAIAFLAFLATLPRPHPQAPTTQTQALPLLLGPPVAEAGPTTNTNLLSADVGSSQDDDDLVVFGGLRTDDARGLSVGLTSTTRAAIRHAMAACVSAYALDKVTPQAMGAQFSGQCWIDLMRTDLEILAGHSVYRQGGQQRSMVLRDDQDAVRQGIVQRLLQVCGGTQAQLHTLSTLMHQGLIGDMLYGAPMRAGVDLVSFDQLGLHLQVDTNNDMLTKFTVHPGEQPGSVGLVAVHKGSISELSQLGDIDRYLPTKPGSWLRYETRLEIAPADDQGRCRVSVLSYDFGHDLQVERAAQWLERD